MHASNRVALVRPTGARGVSWDRMCRGCAEGVAWSKALIPGQPREPPRWHERSRAFEITPRAGGGLVVEVSFPCSTDSQHRRAEQIVGRIERAKVDESHSRVEVGEVLDRPSLERGPLQVVTPGHADVGIEERHLRAGCRLLVEQHRAHDVAVNPELLAEDAIDPEGTGDVRAQGSATVTITWAIA